MLTSRRSIILAILAVTLGISCSAQTRHYAQWENEIRAFEAADKEKTPPNDAILFIGSSSIRMWTDLAKDFPDKKLINRGFGGSQIADSTHFADRIAIPYKPKQIVMYAGDNDLNEGKSPEQVLADYKAFIAKVRAKLPEARFAFIAIKPSPSRAALMPKAAAANALIKKYSDSDKRLSFIDIYTPMLGADGQPRRELFLDDMLHLSRKGYDLWRDTIKPFLK